ncbi:extracellular solute-binding protein [Streptomyces coeruleorubidus]
MNNGGGWTDASGKWAVDQQANVDTLTYLRKLTKDKLTQPNPEATNRKDVFNQFAQGKIGMLNGAVFMRKGFIDPVDAKLNYGVAALPSKDGSTHKTLGVQDYLVAFKKSDGSNKAAVKKFLDFFYQKENAAEFVSTEGSCRSPGRPVRCSVPTARTPPTTSRSSTPSPAPSSPPPTTPHGRRSTAP